MSSNSVANLDGKIGLILELSGEVVRGELNARNQGKVDEIRSELMEQLVVLLQPRGVVAIFVVCKGHDYHVATLLHRLPHFQQVQRAAGSEERLTMYSSFPSTCPVAFGKFEPRSCML